ncbi:hypothetical protein WBG78_07295 [Chryseolinea sp. T2]|uniref:tetratricopeptide repeat protein n=1 Tax=Chryseolinea sp. T2 TaxID=3129255 RepID=UPI003077D5C2
MTKRKSNKKKKLHGLQPQKTSFEVDATTVAIYREAVEAFLYDGDEPNIEGLVTCVAPHDIDDEDKHWTLILVADLLCQENHLDGAFRVISQALRISHDCPRGREVLAVVLCSRGQYAEAIQVWTELLCTPIRRLAYHSCKMCNVRSIPFARHIICNSKFGLSITYWLSGYPALAIHFKREFIKDLERGIESPCDPLDLTGIE